MSGAIPVGPCGHCGSIAALRSDGFCSSICAYQDKELTEYHAAIMVNRTAAEAAAKEFQFSIGDPVEKVGGDYRFDGIVVAAFRKLSGVPRYVVEDDRGILHVYSDKNLKKKST